MLSSIASIELRHLRYFIAVAEHGNFTRAAAVLHMAQPPLSAQIRQLERRVGGELFVRTPGRVQLTDAGATLLEYAYAAVGAVRQGLAALQAADAGELVTLNLMAGHTVEVAPLIRQFGLLHRHDPRLRLDLHYASALEHRVRTGEADAALIRGPVHDAALWQRVVATEPLVAVLAADHPFAGDTGPTLSNLLAHDVVELSEGSIGLGRTCETPEQLLTDVVNTRCVGLLPRHLVPGARLGLAVQAVQGLEKATTLIIRRRFGSPAAAVALTTLMSTEANQALVQPAVRAP